MRLLALALATCAAIGACARSKSDAAARADASGDASTGAISANLALDGGADAARFRGELVEIAATNQVSVCD